MLYNMAQGQSIMVYGYLPGAWAGMVGSLLIITPLMCIPVFLFISLCKVGATICTSIIAKTGVTASLKLIFFPRIPKPWPHLLVICARRDRTSHPSRCVGASSSGHGCSPTGGRTDTTTRRWRRPEGCDEAAQKSRHWRVTHLMREIILNFCACFVATFLLNDGLKWKKRQF